MSKITLEEFKKKANASIDFLKEELSKIRSGRAHPSLVEDIPVEAYGSTQPLKNLSNINVADVSLLVIQPWDKSIIDNIVKAIQESNIGVNPQASGEGIRLPLPQLTQERREEYVKLMKQKLEEARISIRNLRKGVINMLDEDKNESIITEDEYHRSQDSLQKQIDEYNKQIEEIGKKKEDELMKV